MWNDGEANRLFRFVDTQHLPRIERAFSSFSGHELTFHKVAISCEIYAISVRLLVLFRSGNLILITKNRIRCAISRNRKILIICRTIYNFNLKVHYLRYITIKY